MQFHLRIILLQPYPFRLIWISFCMSLEMSLKLFSIPIFGFLSFPCFFIPHLASVSQFYCNFYLWCMNELLLVLLYVILVSLDSKDNTILVVIAYYPFLLIFAFGVNLVTSVSPRVHTLFKNIKAATHIDFKLLLSQEYTYIWLLCIHIFTYRFSQL